MNNKTIAVSLFFAFFLIGCSGDREEQQAQENVSQQPDQNAELYDLKNSINSAIGDSIEEDIRTEIEKQVEKNSGQ